VYRVDGRTVAVKDYSARPWAIRHLVGRALTRRECAAYAAADRLSGLPRFLGRLGPFSMATEWVDGRQLSEFPDSSVDAGRLDRLHAIVTSLHERGVALTDLNHRDILLGDDDQVWILDLAMAWRRGSSRRGPRARIFEHFRSADLFALSRLRDRFCPGRRGDAAETSDAGAVRWHRRARRLKWMWDRLRGAERLPPVNDHWRW
jgi:hypothetical protein